MSEKKATRPEIEPKYSETEEFILRYLYDHPGWDVSTVSLSTTYKAAAFGSEEAKKSFDEIQYGIETLISDQLLSGDRKMMANDGIYFDKLKLTRRGEAEAIAAKRCLVNVTHSAPGPENK